MQDPSTLFFMEKLESYHIKRDLVVLDKLNKCMHLFKHSTNVCTSLNTLKIQNLNIISNKEHHNDLLAKKKVALNILCL